jgi:hypothetical protein
VNVLGVSLSATAGRSTRRIQQGFSLHHGNVPTHKATDPPVQQPKEFLLMVNSYCTNPLNLIKASMSEGGFEVPPPAIIYGADSGAIVEGFEPKADPGSHNISGAVAYSLQYRTAGGQEQVGELSIEFSAVDGMWMLEVSYMTVWECVTNSAVIGKKAIYSIAMGHPHSHNKTC